MSICREEFISALRVAVSAEFSDVPDNENAINFSFSDGFNKKMQKLIKSQKKPYWDLIKTAPKKAAAVCTAIAVLICGAFCVKPVRVSAKEMLEEIIVKTKSIFQTAYENGIPLSEVDSGGDFKYTEFDGEERVTRQDGASPSVTGETFADPKTDIYNKMLNTIDHFNTVELSVNVHLAGDDLTINSYADIDKSLAYEAVYDRGRLNSETFCGAVSFVAKSLIEKYPDALIVFMTPTHRLSEKGRTKNENGIRNDAELRDYVDEIIKICGEYSLPVLDLYRVSGIQPEIEIMREKYMPDGLHPNKYGNAKIASRLEGFLRAL